MAKHEKWKDEAIAYDTRTGEFDLEATISNREFFGDRLVQYTAPKGDQKWRARDLVDIHWKLVGEDPPSESYNRIMSCIIGHANPHTGRCQLNRKLIAIETGYSIDTVKRAIKWWVSRKFLVVEPTGIARSNAYHPQWHLFEMHYLAVEENIKTQKEAWRNEAALQSDAVHQGAPRAVHQGAPRGVHHGAPHESQIGISKEEPHPERAHPPSAADAPPIEDQKEEGIQRGEVERPSPNANPRVEPNVRERLKVVGGTDLYSFLNSDAEEAASAEAAVEEDLRRHSEMYQRVLGWPELECHLADAAASERREEGSGAKLILARFAERRATGT